MESNHFTILIPAFNCAPWVERNLSSALSQKYDNFDVVYINDASTDNTFDLVKNILNQSDKKFKIVSNDVNVRALCNLYSEIRKAKEETIIITLDGDDFLANNEVLSYLNEIYQDKNVWLTVGSYMENTTYNVISPKIEKGFWNSNIRKSSWSFSHLRTFRKKLFDKIRVNDMLDNDGHFFRFTFDRAMMYPMVEMAGPDHIAMIDKVLYIYNRLNPISVDRVHRSEQLRIESHIKDMPPYSRIEKL